MTKERKKFSDKELLEGIKHSNSPILQYIYEQYYPMVYKMVIQNKGNSQEARDIFQDGMIVLYEKSLQTDFVLSSALSTYLFAICRNLWLNKLNRQKKHESLQDQSIDRPDDASMMNDDNSTERQALLKRLLQKIGDSCRKILMKKYYEQRKDKEIADELGLSGADYVKTQRYRCLKQLKALMEKAS